MQNQKSGVDVEEASWMGEVGTRRFAEPKSFPAVESIPVPMNISKLFIVVSHSDYAVRAL